MSAAGRILDHRCREPAPAMHLKLAAIVLILGFGAAGVAIPLLFGCRRRSIQPAASGVGTRSTLRAFAAGVILAIGFVHMPSAAGDSLARLSEKRQYSWPELPVAEFVATAAALGAHLLDCLWTCSHETRGHVSVKGRRRTTLGGDGLQVIGRGELSESEEPLGLNCGPECEEPSTTRYVLVAQILELGIISHSCIIGLSLGVSHKSCTTKPLIAALSFHQFFGGFALGSCISQAQFGRFKEFVMACFFAIAIPGGIAVGLATASFYNPESLGVVAVEGILGSASSGILIYVALVNLIAVEFAALKRCSLLRQIRSFVALFIGAISMSLLAIWT